MAFNFPWTNRVDNQDYVMADDVNALAAGVQAAGDHADGLKAPDILLSPETAALVGESNVDAALSALFTSVSDGKTALVADVETMGGTVTQAGDVATFEELSDGILSIPTGGGASGTLPMETSFGSAVPLAVCDEATVSFEFTGGTSFGSAVPIE